MFNLRLFLKRFIIGLCFLGHVFVSAQNWQDCSNDQITPSNLEDLYQIENDYLINYQGKIYPKIIYRDALHEDLCFVLKDPEQADIIHKAYRQYIAPYLLNDLLEAFSRALLKVCVLFGSNQFSPESSFLDALKEENTAIFDWLSDHPDLFKTFIRQANCPARTACIQNKNLDKYKIVILTTSASGGNHSVAQAIESFLSSFKNIHCIVIDVETIARETDLIMLATGLVTYDGIYMKYYQQAHQEEFLIKRDVISKQLGKYIPSCLGLKLKELIREINPNLILSTRSYSLDDIPLCTLGIPFRMIHCDYELSFFLMNLYGKIRPEMMKFWLPSLEPRIFRPLFEKLNRLDLYDQEDHLEMLIRKIALITQKPIEIIQNQFELLGYPICPEFHYMENEKELELLRKKWTITSEEIPVLVLMGKNGVGILEKVFDEILVYPKHRLSLKYIFVTGKNLDLQRRLEAKNALNKEKNCIIYGLISPQEMNELMNICPLIIAKPGGAITSEALEVGSHLLIVYSHPWEEANGFKIEKLGLGQKLQKDQSLVVQVEDYIEKIFSLKRSSYHNVSWKEHLIRHIQSIKADLLSAYKEKK